MEQVKQVKQVDQTARVGKPGVSVRLHAGIQLAKLGQIERISHIVEQSSQLAQLGHRWKTWRSVIRMWRVGWEGFNLHHFGLSDTVLGRRQADASASAGRKEAMSKPNLSGSDRSVTGF